MCDDREIIGHTDSYELYTGCIYGEISSPLHQRILLGLSVLLALPSPREDRGQLHTSLVTLRGE